MALVRIRHASIYRNGKKIATCYTNRYHIASGDEPAFDDDGLAGMTDGATTVTLESHCIIPVAGTDPDLVDDLLKKRNVDMTIGLVNGRIHEINMRTLEADFESDAKSGRMDGTFRWMGGVPAVA